MGIINLKNIIKSFSGNVVLDGIDIEVFQNEIVAMIGRNGSGKTTIFNLIIGETDADEGSISIQKNLSISYLKQIPSDFFGMSSGEVIKTAFINIEDVEKQMQKAYVDMGDEPDNRNLILEYGRLHDKFEFIGGYDTNEKFNRITKGLGIPDRIISSQFNTLSGGEKTTVMLAKALLSGPDVLLLDEPTNHLDMDARRWLEMYMSNYRGSIIYTSHDRYFIDETAHRVIEIEQKKAYVYKGNFSEYKKQKQENEERNLKLYEKQSREAARLNETALRMRNFATEKTIHIAKAIEKRIERIDIVNKPVTERTLHMAISQTHKIGREVLSASDISKSYGENVLFHNVDFLVRAGERIAVIGPNGAGKSTLIKIIIENIHPDTGVIRKGRGIKYAYLEQDVKFSHENATVLEEVCNELDLSISSARNILGKYLFTGEDVFKKIGVLSGGEKSRLRLLLEMRESVNLLLLDEPTNHLDIASREELEKAIGDFSGTMMFISHDRQFINNFADCIFEIRNSEFRIFRGNYDDYLEKSIMTEPEKKQKIKKPGQRQKGREKRRADFTIRRVEEKIHALERQIELMDSEIQINSTDYEKLTKLTEERDELMNELSADYEKWMELTDE